MHNTDKLHSALKEEVLNKERKDFAEQSQRDKIDALTAALTETTSLDKSKISSVITNLQEEAVNSSCRPAFTLPSLNTKYIRVAIYLIAGVLAYSTFKSGQLESLEQEQYYDSISDHPKYDFYSELSTIKMVLSDDYTRYFREHNAFPDSAENLGRDSNRYLNNSRFIQSYHITGNGIIKLSLSDQYGYHRFIELAPKQQKSFSSWHLEFNCRSNAQDHLLHDSGRYWCEPTERAQVKGF